MGKYARRVHFSDFLLRLTKISAQVPSMPMKFTCVLPSLLSVSLAFLQPMAFIASTTTTNTKLKLPEIKKKCEQLALQARACHVALFVVIFVVAVIIVFGCSNIVG